MNKALAIKFISSSVLLLALFAFFSPLSTSAFAQNLVSPITPPVNNPNNHNPYFMNHFLKLGTQGKSYSVKVKAIDRDEQNVLSMSATGLPGGLSLTNCSQEKNNNRTTLTCYITGTPITSGNSTVTLKVTDNHGGQNTRTTFLWVKPSKQWWNGWPF